MNYKKFGLLLILFFVIFSFNLQSEELKVKVIVDKANIRLKPDLSSPIIGKAELNQILEVLGEENTNTGKWFMIRFKSKEGYLIYGYIHNSVVEVIKPKASEPPAKPKPTPPPTPPSPPKPPVPPTPPKPKAPSFKRFFIRADIGYGSKKYSYENNWNFEEYYETGDVSESYDIDSSGILFEGGIGFYFIRNLGLEISFNPASGKTKGSFSVNFPHPFYFNAHREKSWEADDLKYSAQEINLNLIFNFQPQRNLNFYVSFGGTYFLNVTIENLKQISWSEIGYPYTDVNLSPEYAEYSNSAFGFNGGAGIDFFFMENMGLNLNFRYSTGSVKIDVEGAEIEVKTGGIRASGGIKLVF